MDKETRNAIERATQRARKLLEEDFTAQLEGDFDVHLDGTVSTKPSRHLSPRQAFQRDRIIASIEHKRAAGMSAADSVRDYLRDSAFSTLNRFVALKMLEARELVQECITKGEESIGYREFCGMAPGLPLLPDSSGYRLYIESLFDELSTEVKVLFDRRDPSSMIWPKRATFDAVLEILNSAELCRVWGEDETIGWVYQYFNGQDERRKIREESQAPRNSRELAIRNQFFTPRYVVQFLTDNTLGRVWYEMRAAKTELVNKCGYLIHKLGAPIPPRQQRDPRDLRVLDPACGSGHFLLYAFDLLLIIYQEAYRDPSSPKSEATGKTLQEDYANTQEFQRAVPGLILEHNLHGVDIDSRCAQIAQLALWIRAQRAHLEHGVGRADRPRIRRSNVVVAEPLAADEQVIRDFISDLDNPQLGQVLHSLTESLRLAGSMGVLLRLEKLVQVGTDQGELFVAPEEHLRQAIVQLSKDEILRPNARRRLFADDASHAIALLCLVEKKFDVVLMNPPFGAGCTEAKSMFEKSYPASKNDIYAAFVERGIELLTPSGILGAITSRTGFFLSSFRRWRQAIIEEAPPVVFADLGLGVMDAALVEAAAYCLARNTSRRIGATAFLRVIEELSNKEEALKEIVSSHGAESEKRWFEIDPKSFQTVPGAPFAYWVSHSMRELYGTRKSFGGQGRVARVGLQTSDDFRYLRTWWEVNPIGSGKKWFLFAKGGKYSPYYADVQLCVNWSSGEREMSATHNPTIGKPYSNIWMLRDTVTKYFFRAGITWPRRTTSEFSPRALPSNCIFADKGPAAFAGTDDPQMLLALLAVLNSKVFRSLLEFQLAAAEGAARSYEIGIVEKTPVPDLSAVSLQNLATLAKEAWLIKRELDARSECSHAFAMPSVFNGQAPGSERYNKIQLMIDDLCFSYFGIGLTDRAMIERSFERMRDACETELEQIDDGDDDPAGSPSELSIQTELYSWLVGVVFGRFDPRLLKGSRSCPPTPNPFDEIPWRSPGMYPEGEEPQDLPVILVDDEGNRDDLVTRIQSIADELAIENCAPAREWFAKEFFPIHLKMYSKNRRRAPIYWQLATPSARYSIWFYLHGVTKDTLFRIQNDYAVPKLLHEERRLESLVRQSKEFNSASLRKEIASQEAFIEELRAFEEDIRRVAPLWNPNLDDGVIINFAPLWRLVPHHKAWQKELKATWGALCEGKYDWTYLAMHLWPERVVPKCAEDRGLAIAHGLEEIFWVEGTDGKWTSRKTPPCAIDELITARTSPAVKAALKSLIEAPVASGSTGRKGRNRKASAVTEGGYV